MYYLSFGKIVVIILMGFVLGVAFSYVFQSSSITELQSTIEALSEAQKLSLEDVISKNPSLATNYVTSYSDVIGGTILYPHISPGISLLISDNKVVGVMYIRKASEGWFPNADQPEGEPLVGTTGNFYTQTIIFSS